MKKYPRNFRIIVTFWYLSSLQTSARHEALVFDRCNRSLYDIPPQTPRTSQCGAWATACPAQYPHEEEFVRDIAYTENALFVQSVYTKEKTMEEANFEKSICEKAFGVSVLFSKKNFAFEFGYEIYFAIGDLGRFEESPRENFISPKILFEHLKEILKVPKLVFKELKRSISGEMKSLWYNGDRKMGLTWIRLFHIKFDFIRKTPKRIVYQIRNNNKWPLTWHCSGYHLAKEAYGDDVDFAYLYSTENQLNMFYNVKLPEVSTQTSCGARCVMKWLLVPVDQFHFGTSRASICSNMATVPIWISTIGPVMKKLDKYLYILFRVTGPGLHIISGVTGQLSMPKIKSKIWEWPAPTKDIYLDTDDQKIPVHAVLYKVVKYKPANCPEEDNCWYSATIVVHNDPYFDPKRKICEKDVTREWNWNELLVPSTLNYHSKYIYVCPSSSKVLKRLMGRRASRREPPKMLDLNLDAFPSYEAVEDQPSAQANTSIKFELRTDPITVQVTQKFMELWEREARLRPSYLDRVPEGDEEEIESSRISDESQLARLSGALEPQSSDVIVERPREDQDVVTVDEVTDEDGAENDESEGIEEGVRSDDDAEASSGSSEPSVPDVAVAGSLPDIIDFSHAEVNYPGEGRVNSSPVSEPSEPFLSEGDHLDIEHVRNRLLEPRFQGQTSLTVDASIKHDSKTSPEISPEGSEKGAESPRQETPGPSHGR